MKRIIVLVMMVCIFLSGCHTKKETITKLADLSYKKGTAVECEIYIKENNEYVPYLVLTDEYQDKVLLLRKEISLEHKRISNYSAEYEKSEIDNYLNTEYLELFSESIRKEMESVDIEVAKKETLYSVGTSTKYIKRKVFLLSYTELGYSEHMMAPVEGQALTYFVETGNRVAMKENDSSSWWLRTPYTGYDSVSWLVGEDGIRMELSSSYLNGIRPAFCMSPDTEVIESKEVVEGKTVYILE